MKTTATNRKVRELLTGLRSGKLVPRPEFQRRLVWSNKDRVAFIETVLLGFPFPEIYVAAGEVDFDSGEANEMLVDGQQRVTTLNQYFVGAPDLKLPASLKPYVGLSKAEKEQFLQYDVVVRDLGRLSIDDIREVFRRINATRYALNAMEIHNARYAGQYKEFAELVAQNGFFERHRVFSPGDVRRMQDTLFVLLVVTTILSTYFNRDIEIEDYLQKYNDEFSDSAKVHSELETVFKFIDDMDLPSGSRAWKKADLFTLLVEVHRGKIKNMLALEPKALAPQLEAFYDLVEAMAASNPGLVTDEKVAEQARAYYRAALQASNDRSSRVARGDAIRFVIERASSAPLLAGA
jgi:hypothetical protein